MSGEETDPTYGIKRKLFDHSPPPRSVSPEKRVKVKWDLQNCRKWTVDDVCSMLEEHDYENLIPLFRQEKISGKCLPEMTMDRLQNFSEITVGQRFEILSFIKVLGLQQPQTTLFSNVLHKFKVFNDPIHGHIEIHPVCMRIIDTPQFQRLRNITQLGGCYHVFPGATNRRFEHSIGVSHLAGQFARILRNKQPELNITEQDILCVELAGLCHDLGHGPFSHMFDGKFIPKARPGCDWRHEEASANMLDYIIESNDLMDCFREHELSDIDITFVKEQITGPRQGETLQGRDDDKKFLYQIVANKSTGIDVDKFDYFARDCHSLGIQNNFDHNRFMKFMRVITIDGQRQMCSRDKEVHNIYGLFHTRSELHKRAYQHRVGNIVEEMITEALLKADPYIQYEGTDGRLFRISECIDDMCAFSKLNDYVYQQILQSTSECLQPARHILNRIETRKLYPYIGQCKPEEATQSIVTDVNVYAAQIAKGTDLKSSDFIIDRVRVNYGMGKKNPLENVLFYKKEFSDKAFKLRKREIPVSDLLPSTFSDEFLRVFVKETSQMDEATSAFNRWCEKTKMKKQLSCDAYDLSVTLTPYNVLKAKSDETVATDFVRLQVDSYNAYRTPEPEDM